MFKKKFQCNFCSQWSIQLQFEKFFLSNSVDMVKNLPWSFCYIVQNQGHLDWNQRTLEAQSMHPTFLDGILAKVGESQDDLELANHQLLSLCLLSQSHFQEKTSSEPFQWYHQSPETVFIKYQDSGERNFMVPLLWGKQMVKPEIFFIYQFSLKFNLEFSAFHISASAQFILNLIQLHKTQLFTVWSWHISA